MERTKLLTLVGGSLVILILYDSVPISGSLRMRTPREMENFFT